jgi:antitoxin VapB
MIYTIDSYHLREGVMADTAIARLFTHGRSQAVRLPKEFRLPGDRVRVRHVGDGVLLEPIASDVDAWFAELDRFADVPLFEDGRNQPPMPPGEDIFG